MTELSERLDRLDSEKQRLLRLLLQKKNVDQPQTHVFTGSENKSTSLSFTQQRLWFLHQLRPKDPVYNEARAVYIRGRLDFVSLEKALAEIVRRHGSLRTTFTMEGEDARQFTSPDVSLDLQNVDLRQMNTDECDMELNRVITEAWQQPFDLTRGPLLRVRVIGLHDDKQVLLVVMHHIVSDAWSMGILLKEFTTLYSAFVSGLGSPLPPLTVQYADYTVWQWQRFTSNALEPHLDYWRKKLAGVTSLELPFCLSRPPVQTYRGSTFEFDISSEVVADLKSLARKKSVTLYMLLLAVFKTLLHRYTGQADICIGTHVAGRTRREFESIIGFMVNTLALRTDLSGNPTFSTLLDRVKSSTLDAYVHQETPFEQLVSDSDIARDLSRSPIFQIVFSLQNVPAGQWRLPGLEVESYPLELPVAKFDMTVNLTEADGLLHGAIEYNVDLFRKESIQRLVVHYQNLLQSILSEPDCHLSELPLLSKAEQQQLIREWNATEVDYPREACLHTLISAQAQHSPEAIAVVSDTRILTYAELERRANELAHCLLDYGVDVESRVGVCLERSTDLVIALLAILKAGAAYVPLDPDYPVERLCFMALDADLTLILTEDQWCGRFTDQAAALITLKALDEVLPGKPKTAPVVNIRPENIAYVIYTSGSTGRPKGVMVPHKGICNRLNWMQQQYSLTNTDRVLQKTTFSFDVSVWEFFWPLICGAQLVMAKPGGHKDSAYLASTIRDLDITTIHFVPSMLQVFLDVEELESCTSLRRVICSGEALPLDLQNRFLARSTAELHNLYGPTEASVDVSYWHCVPPSPNDTQVPIGRPIANTQLYILDPHMSPVPAGVVGELYIGGVGLARGYLSRPELTAERFIPDLFGVSEGGRLYKTGDLARYRSDGSIEFLGRSDHQVKLRGFRIELGEIERILLQHPAVREAVVLAREDQPGDQRLVAYVVAVSSRIVDVQALNALLREQLPDYMVPGAIVTLPAMPLGSSGKVDRRQLPAPENYGYSNPALDYVPPSSPTETIIAGVWAEVLGRTNVGMKDNFFELGGHSLLATRVISRLERIFNMRIPLNKMFEAHTLKDLAHIVDAELSKDSPSSIPPITPTDRSGPSQLSFAQQRLWFMDQLLPNHPLYNIAAAVRMEGEINVPALESSLCALVDRHEALRTTFQVVNGNPVQVICAHQPIKLKLLNVGIEDRVEAEAVAIKMLHNEARIPFDLGTGPLLRACLVCAADDTHFLLLCMHHIVSDGWSMSVVVDELLELYSAYCSGGSARLEPLPIQYADYASWQRQWMQGEMLEQQLVYWKRQLSGMPYTLSLPADYPRPAAQTYSGSQFKFTLDAKLVREIRDLGNDNGATLFMTLLAGFQALLYRYTGQADFGIGSPIANRHFQEIERLIGFFVNTLVLRAKIEGNFRFTELLAAAKETAMSAYANQDMPFERLIDELQPQRIANQSPVVQVIFALQNIAVRPLTLNRMRLTPVEIDTQTSKFDLYLFFVEQDEGTLRGCFEYNTDLFMENTIAQFAESLESLFRGVVADPNQRISDLHVLTEKQKTRIAREWNESYADFPQQYCAHHLVERQVEKNPDRPAVLNNNKKLSYTELNRRANKLARYLRSRGVGPETVVGLSAVRSAEQIVCLLGIMKSGGAYLPLDPAYPQERLAYMLADSKAKFVITIEQNHLSLEAHGFESICMTRDWDLIDTFEETALEDLSGPQNLAYVIYTSGSTGRPKGVALSHYGLVNLATAQADIFALSSDDRVLQFASTSFDASVWETFMALSSGACLVLARSGLPLVGDELCAFLREQRISIATLPPSALSVVDETVPIPKLRTLIVAGENCTAELVARWGQSRHFYNAYGPTESTVCATLTLCRSNEPVPSIGRPIANTRVYILDQRLQPVPVGVIGELYIGGVGLARGYLNRPDLTAERFIPDSFDNLNGGRLYKTGDLARYRHDGNLEFVGRSDHQVKLRGFRVELGEIERILQQHPTVREALVVAREDSPGDQRLVAYVVSDRGSQKWADTHIDARRELYEDTGQRPVATKESTSESTFNIPSRSSGHTNNPIAEEEANASRSLREFLSSKLPDYMLPTSINILEAFPLTPNGKVDRSALPVPGRESAAGAYVAPRNALEQSLSALWGELLGLEQVGVEDNFFELGGHSLLATQVVSQWRARHGQEMPLRTLFARPTISALAEYLAMEETQGEQCNIEPVSREHPLPLSFGQQRIWFLDRLESGNPAYNIAAAMRLRGELDRSALQAALQGIVDRHEALRTRFETRQGRPVQVIAPEQKVTVDYVELQDCPVQEREAQVQAHTEAEAGRSFDLSSGPLLRVRVLCLDAEEHVLLITLHHIIADGWSVGVFIQELTLLYRAEREHTQAQLPALNIQYADFAAWQRGYLQGEVLERELEYWRTQLAEVPTSLELTTDYARPAVQSYRGATHRFEVPGGLSEALQSFSHRHGATLFMTMLAAFQVLLGRYARQNDFLIGTPIANRQRAEVEPLIGFFVNTLVLRAQLGDDPTVEELIARVRETALSAYAHQDLPFEQLVDGMQLPRAMSHSPLFQVMFSLQNAPKGRFSLPGLTVESVPLDPQIAKFDLTLNLTEEEGLLHGEIEYNIDLFRKESIQRMVIHYQNLLRSILASPHVRISELPLLSEAEQQQIVREWNSTAVDYPRNACLHTLVSAQAQRSPQAIAVISENLVLTYAELEIRANELAHCLRDYGVDVESRVGVCLERGIDLVLTLLAILKAGAAYVPLDPDYPVDRLSFMARDADLTLILTDDQWLDRFTGQGVELLTLKTLNDARAAKPKIAPVVNIQPENIAYVIYTSGSTGRPKGVMVPHKGICNRLNWMQQQYNLTDADRVLQKTTFSFDVSVWEFFWPLISGAQLVMAKPGGHRDSAYLASIIRDMSITTIHFVPSMLQVFLDTVELESCVSLRRVICSGEALPLELQNRFLSRCATELHNLYGPTEASVDVSYWHCEPALRDDTQVPIGRPIANIQLYVLDPHMYPVPSGVVGELYIGGVGLARGYLGRPELTADRFIPDPFCRDEGGRLYKTGDLVRYRPDGNIEFLGRCDHQVKLRGFRIELGEIEATISRISGVAQVLVVLKGENSHQQHLAAFVVMQPDNIFDEEFVRQDMKKTLPDFMVPATFTVLDRMPLTTNGKIDRKVLFSMASDFKRNTLYVPPGTNTEKLIAQICVKVLGVEKIGINDNFFDVGANSLLVVVIHNEVCQQRGEDFPLIKMFEYPTIATLSSYLTTQKEEAGADVKKRAERLRSGKNRQQARRQRIKKTTNVE